MASIMVLLEIKEQFDCFKAAYVTREGSATNEQILLRWMDSIGSPFDSKLAQEARKMYRQYLQTAKVKPEAPDPETEDKVEIEDPPCEA